MQIFQKYFKCVLRIHVFALFAGSQSEKLSILEKQVFRMILSPWKCVCVCVCVVGFLVPVFFNIEYFQTWDLI